jgi:putative glycosyltransferase (TIGR04372 family)
MLKYFKGRSIGYVMKHVTVSPLVLLVWLAIEITNFFRPVFIVKLSYKGRITQYIRPMELHLRNANQLNRKYLMIFVMPAATPNEAVRTVYRRYSIIVDSHFTNFIRRTFSILAVLLKSRFTPALPNWQELWQQEPATTLTNYELKFGEELLEKLGIPKGAQYVCLGVKEAAYYASITPDRGYGQDLRRQAIDSRNVNIDNYLLAATHLANQGIYVVRVGSVVGAPLPKERHPMVIDYATTHRSELGDITLGAKSKFCLTGAGGIWVFSATQNRPVAYCDQYEFGYENDMLSQGTHTIWTLRTLRNRETNSSVPFYKMALGGQKWADDALLNSLGYEPVPNTPEEILNATIEMNDWIDGKLELSKFDEELQTKFYDCYPPETRKEKNLLVKISPSFLRKYQDLL